MLEVQQLTRSYGDLVAVNDVSFSIRTGEIVGLLGHNGAGKTTIMKMLSGYLEPDSGQIQLGEHDVLLNPKLAQRGLGYLPENLPVYPELTVADYLDYAASLKGMRGEERIAEIRRAVAATELSGRLHTTIATLSRGFKQRVGVAQAILGRPRLLILDEPTNGLDPTQTEQMRKLICKLSSNATIILSTHILQEVEAICSRVLILNDGKLAVDAQMDDLRALDNLLLGTDATPDQLKELLLPLPGVRDIQTPSSSQHRYIVSLEKNTDKDRVAASIASTIVGAGATVHLLSPEQRDLASLFSDASSSTAAEGALNHAA